MISLNLIIWFTLTIEIMDCTRDVATVELSYEQNILSPNRIAERLACPQERNEMFSWCDALFSRAHYRSYMKVFSSQLGFDLFKPMCQYELITFISNPGRFPTDRTEFMLPCVGRHEPIRTQPQVDDFYDRFLLAATPDMKVFYVFNAEKLGQDYVFKLYEEILDMTVPIPNVPITKEVQLRESVLLSIPTTNPWKRGVERIYVNEVIAPNKPIEDRLQGIQSHQLYMLCSFILARPSYGSELFFVDRERLDRWDGKPAFIRLYFDSEDPSYNGAKQLSYPCYGNRPGGKTTENEKCVNLHRISSGPRENSILLYFHLGHRQDYKIRHFLENIFLNELLATPPPIQPPAEEAGPSEPPSKRMRTEQMAPPTIPRPMPPPSVAPSHTPASPIVRPIWMQRYPFQVQDEPSPDRTAGLIYPLPTPVQRPPFQLRPTYPTTSRDQQLPTQAAVLSHQTPIQPFQIQAEGPPYQTSATSQPHTAPLVGSSHHVFSSDQQFPTQVGGGLPRPTTSTIAGQQYTPPVGFSYFIPWIEQEPTIPAAGPPITSSDEQFQAGAGEYSSAFQSTHESDQFQYVGDYEFDLFDDGSDPPNVADLFDTLNQVNKNDPGPSGPSENP